MPKQTFLINHAILYCAAAFMVSVPFLSAFAVDPDQQAVTPKVSVDDCLQSGIQVHRMNAAQRVIDCSNALQSHKLTPGQVAVARINRGVARMAVGDKGMADIDYQEALKHYDSVIDPKQPDSLALYRRGVALNALGETDRALTDYSEAIRLDPAEPLAYFERGVVLATRKRAYGRAIADFNRALELAPNNVEAFVYRGDAYGQMGDFARSLSDLDRAVGLAPDYQLAYFFRGLANSRRGQNALALNDYNTALKIHPRYVDALVSRAAIYAIDGKADLALGDLDAAIAIESNNPIAYYIYMKLGDPAIAIVEYSAALEHDPNRTLALYGRGLARIKMGNKKEGEADQAAARALKPSIETEFSIYGVK